MFNVGVTDGELIIIAVLLISGILGQDFWLTPVSSFVPGFAFNLLILFPWMAQALNISIKFYVLYIMIGSFLVLCSLALISTVKGAKNRTEAIIQNVPVLFLLTLSKSADITFTLILLSKKDFLWKNTRLYATSRSLVSLIFGLNFSLFTCRLIVCSLTEVNSPTFFNGGECLTVHDR